MSLIRKPVGLQVLESGQASSFFSLANLAHMYQLNTNKYLDAGDQSKEAKVVFEIAINDVQTLFSCLGP